MLNEIIVKSDKHRIISCHETRAMTERQYNAYTIMENTNKNKEGNNEEKSNKKI